MEEFSYDGTEQTPLPKMFRPPPMHPQQTNTFSSAIGNDASQAQTATGAESNRLLQVSSALRHTDESILSYSMLEEAADETLPSFPVQPPSPAQNPGNSLLGEDFSHIGTPAGPLPFTSSKNDFQKPRDRVHNHTTPMTTATTVGSSQTRPYTATQPPISEVHVEKSHQESSSDHDTFFECLEDQSIAQRARRSMQRQTPPAAPPSSNQRQYSTNSNNNNITNNNTSHIPFHIDSLSLSPSMTSSFWTMEQPQDFTPQEQRQSNQRHQFTPDTASESNIPPTPSPVQVSQVHESALQALLRLKEELIKSNKKNQTLIAQNKALKEDGQKQQVHWQSKIQNLQDELSNVQESLDASSKTLQDERQSWTTEKEQLAEKLRTVTRERKEAMHRKVASENRSKELKHQLEQTKADLDQTTQEHAQLAQKYSALSREKAKVEQEKFQLESKLATLTSSQAQQTKEEVRELSQLRADLQAKDQTIASLKSSLEEANRLRQQDYQKYQADAQNWQQRYKNDTQLYKTQLERLKTALHNAATPRSSEYAVTPTPTHNNSGKTLHTVPTQQQDPTPPLESSIADRLARMRDSAERAQLIKAHKRDLARIKLEYDQQIQKLISNHQEVLRKTKEEADAVLASQLDTLKKTLSQDYYQKLQEAEAQHQEKFTKVNTILSRLVNRVQFIDAK